MTIVICPILNESKFTHRKWEPWKDANRTSNPTCSLYRESELFWWENVEENGNQCKIVLSLFHKEQGESSPHPSTLVTNLDEWGYDFYMLRDSMGG